jgi:hypothetical protein
VGEDEKKQHPPRITSPRLAFSIVWGVGVPFMIGMKSTDLHLGHVMLMSSSCVGGHLLFESDESALEILYEIIVLISSA